MNHYSKISEHRASNLEQVSWLRMSAQRALWRVVERLEAEMLASKIASSIGAGQVKFVRGVLVAIISVLCVANAKAVPITYTETATISGSLNGVSFTNTLLTLTGTGDTATVGGAGTSFGFVENLVTATFSLAGVASGLLTDGSNPTPYVVFDFHDINQSGLAGFRLAGDNGNLNIFNAVFATYNLDTPIGPVTGPATQSVPSSTGGGFPTSVGSLFITSTGNGTFTAVVPTPIPGALPLFAAGLGLLGLLAWRRKRKAAV